MRALSLLLPPQLARNLLAPPPPPTQVCSLPPPRQHTHAVKAREGVECTPHTTQHRAHSRSFSALSFFSTHGPRRPHHRLVCAAVHVVGQGEEGWEREVGGGGGGKRKRGPNRGARRGPLSLPAAPGVRVLRSGPAGDGVRDVHDQTRRRLEGREPRTRRGARFAVRSPQPPRRDSPFCPSAPPPPSPPHASLPT